MKPLSRESRACAALAVPVGVLCFLVGLLNLLHVFSTNLSIAAFDIFAIVTGVIALCFALKGIRRALTPGILECLGSILMGLAVGQCLLFYDEVRTYWETVIGAHQPSYKIIWEFITTDVSSVLLLLAGLLVAMQGVATTSIIAETKHQTYMPSAGAAFGFFTLMCCSCSSMIASVSFALFSRLPPFVGLALGGSRWPRNFIFSCFVVAAFFSWLPLLHRPSKKEGRPWVRGILLLIAFGGFAGLAVGAGLKWSKLKPWDKVIPLDTLCLFFSTVAALLLLTFIFHITCGFLHEQERATSDEDKSQRIASNTRAQDFDPSDSNRTTAAKPGTSETTTTPSTGTHNDGAAQQPTAASVSQPGTVETPTGIPPSGEMHAGAPYYFGLFPEGSVAPHGDTQWRPTPMMGYPPYFSYYNQHPPMAVKSSSPPEPRRGSNSTLPPQSASHPVRYPSIS